MDVAGTNIIFCINDCKSLRLCMLLHENNNIYRSQDKIYASGRLTDPNFFFDEYA